MPSHNNYPILALNLAITPVMVGSSLAWAETQQFDWQMATIPLLIGLLIQIGYTRLRHLITLRPLGGILGEEIAFFLLFGPISLLSCYYLQTNSISVNSLFAACAIGLQAAAISLAGNSVYPTEGVGSHPFSILTALGPQRSQGLYSSLLLLPFLTLLPVFFFRPVAGIALITLSPSIRMIRFYCDAPRGPEFSRILKGTATLQLITGIGLCAGLLFG